MNIATMHRAVKLGLDKSSALELPAFESEEIDYWLNNAQLKKTKKIVSLIKASIGTSPLEITELNIAPLIKPIVIGVTKATIGTGNMHYYYTTNFEVIPDNFLDVLNVRAYVNRTMEDGTTVTNAPVWCKFIGHNDIEQYLSTPFNKPYFENPVIYSVTKGTEGSGNFGFQVIADYYTSLVSFLYIQYVRTPIEMSLSSGISCELNETLHQDIVDLAVSMLLENIESSRLQSKVAVDQL